MQRGRGNEDTGGDTERDWDEVSNWKGGGGGGTVSRTVCFILFCR